MRSFLVLLAFGAAGYLLVSEVALRGGGARVDGSRVTVETTDLEATFTKTLALEESYMLFGGNHDRHPNLLTDAILAVVFPGIAVGVEMQQRKRTAVMSDMCLDQWIRNKMITAEREQG